MIHGPDLKDIELAIMIDEDKIDIATAWTHGLDESSKKDMIDVLRNSTIQFDGLRKILEKLYRECILRQESKGRYEFELGYNRAIRDVYRLIPGTKGERK